MSTQAKMKKVCIVGASGKLGQYMVEHSLARGYEVVGVCREASVGKLDKFKGRIIVIPGATNEPHITQMIRDSAMTRRKFRSTSTPQGTGS